MLPRTLAAVARSSDEKLRRAGSRLVDIWDERKVGAHGPGRDAAGAGQGAGRGRLEGMPDEQGAWMKGLPGQ